MAFGRSEFDGMDIDGNRGTWVGGGGLRRKEKKEDCEYMVTFGGSEFDGKGVDGNRGMWVGGGIKH